MDAVLSWLHLRAHGISSLPGEISGGEDEEEEVAMRIIKIVGFTIIGTLIVLAFLFAAI